MDSDVDLIPQEFRRWRQRTRHLRWTVIATLGGIGLIGVSALALGREATLVEHANVQHNTQAALVAQQQEQLASIERRYGALREEWTLLRGLRSGASVEDLFILIDEALLGGEIWFEDWRLRRAGVVAPDATTAVNTGYFIVVPAGPGTTQSDQWQVRTTMEVRGQALDHAALSRFVRGLYDQPDVLDVKLTRTSRHVYNAASVVDFALSITLTSDATREVDG